MHKEPRKTFTMENNEHAVMEVINSLLGDTACNHPPQCPPPVGPVPAVPGPGLPVTLSQTYHTVQGLYSGGPSGWVNRGYGHMFQQQAFLMANFNISLPAQMYRPAGLISQGQYYNAPVNHFSHNTVSDLRPAGILNGQGMACFPPAAAQINAVSNSNVKRKREKLQDNDPPQAKRPLNAFMHYLREQRNNLEVTDCVVASKILGERWKQLSDEQQAKYYEQARKEARLHDEQHSECSVSDVFVQKEGETINPSGETPGLSDTPVETSDFLHPSSKTPMLPDLSVDDSSISDSYFDDISLSEFSVETSNPQDSRVDTPSLLDSREASPSLADSRHETSCFAELRVATPSLADSRDDTPSLPDSTLETPSVQDSSVETPCPSDSDFDDISLFDISFDTRSPEDLTIETPDLTENTVESYILSHWSPSCNNFSYDFGQMLSVFESEMAAEKCRVARRVNTLPDLTIEVPGLAQSSPSTECSMDHINQLVSNLESEMASVKPESPDWSVMTPGHSDSVETLSASESTVDTSYISESPFVTFGLPDGQYSIFDQIKELLTVLDRETR